VCVAGILELWSVLFLPLHPHNPVRKNFPPRLCFSSTHYFLLLSPHTGLPASLPSKRSKRKHGPWLSWFPPILNTQLMDRMGKEDREQADTGSTDSDNPFGVGLLSLPVFSPSIHSKR
uniref:Uncharacterized protein n=1 Tax=Electrophorus electricus TaxID=8005 RepID=A0AAY5ETG6_ELEEL